MQTSSSPGCGSGRQGPEEGRAQGHAAGKRGASIRTRVLGRGGILSDMALSCSNRQKLMTEPGRPREDEPRGFALLRSHPLPSPARQGTGRVAQGGRLRHAEDHEATSTRAAGPSLRPLRQPRAPASPASFFLAANSRPGRRGRASPEAQREGVTCCPRWPRKTRARPSVTSLLTAAVLCMKFYTRRRLAYVTSVW